MSVNEITSIEGDVDIFITAIGFEDRSLGVINILNNYNFSKAFILKYEPVIEVPPSIENEKMAHKKLSQLGTVLDVIIDPTNPIPALKKLFSQLLAESISTMTIDISVMSKYVLLLILRFLTEERLINKVNFLYTEPNNYVDDNMTPLSFGTSIFETVPTFAGEHNSRSDNLLILMLGFEGKRAYSVWDRIEPDKCVLTIPSPPFNISWINRTRTENSALINSVGEKHVQNIDSRNPFLALDSLNKILSDYDPDNKMNRFIIPMGTKPQTIASFLFYWKNNHNPTIMYPNPKKHSKISKGIGRINQLKLPELH